MDTLAHLGMLHPSTLASLRRRGITPQVGPDGAVHVTEAEALHLYRLLHATKRARRVKGALLHAVMRWAKERAQVFTDAAIERGGAPGDVRLTDWGHYTSEEAARRIDELVAMGFKA